MESRQCDARHVEETDEVHQLRMKVADSKGKCDINNYSALASTTRIEGNSMSSPNYSDSEINGKMANTHKSYERPQILLYCNLPVRDSL
jgi:hypothetical protein